MQSLLKSSDKGQNCHNLQRLQQNCPDFKAIYKYKTTDEVPDDEKQARTLVAEASQFEIQNGLLYHFYISRGLPREERLVKQLAVPKIMRDDILRSYHDSLAGGGHQGHERTFAAIRLKYYCMSRKDSLFGHISSVNKSNDQCMQNHHRFSRCLWPTSSVDSIVTFLEAYLLRKISICIYL